MLTVIEAVPTADALGDTLTTAGLVLVRVTTVPPIGAGAASEPDVLSCSPLPTVTALRKIPGGGLTVALIASDPMLGAVAVSEVVQGVVAEPP